MKEPEPKYKALKSVEYCHLCKDKTPHTQLFTDGHPTGYPNLIGCNLCDVCESKLDEY